MAGKVKYGEKSSSVLKLRIPGELKERFKARAMNDGGMSEVMIRLLKKYLEGGLK